MFQIAIYILLAPLVAFAINIFFGKKLPHKGNWVSLIAIWSGLFASCYLFFRYVIGIYEPGFNETLSIEWLTWGDYKLVIGITLDNMAIVMLVVVTLVSAVVHLFSVGYMHGDPKYHRFFAFLSLFSFSMLGLVLADNILIIYAFWELVGLSSYLLIGFWHEKDSASDAAKKAFVVNRVGDAGMLIGILLVFTTLGTLNLHEIADGVSQGLLTGGLLTIAGLCLFCGAVGKSAQVPLHVWLPDAMEGPTPVSALIHAATMVAAGVYLVARLFVILTFDASVVIAYVGGFTALFAATIAVAQYDIKRVLAYSTLSQLGYMVMALGAGSYMAGFFHLTTHAMFKACLFLGSGSVIHAMHIALHHIHSDDDPQDMRFMGGIKKHLPLTFITFMIATVALSGVPLTSGFLSKDAILGGTLAFSMLHPQHWLLPVFGFSAAILTAFYMFRLVYMTFFGEFRPGKEAESQLHESPLTMTFPLVILATLSTFIFFSLNPANPASGWFGQLFPDPPRAYENAHVDEHIMPAGAEEALNHDIDKNVLKHHTDETDHAVAESHGSGHDEHIEHIHHVAHTRAMILSIILATLGILIATWGYYWKKTNPDDWKKRLGVIYQGMFNKWWTDEIYDATVVRGTIGFAKLMALFDQYVIDGIVHGAAWIWRLLAVVHGWFDNNIVDGLVNLAAWIIGILGRIVRVFQGGQIQRYVWYTLVLVGLFIVIKVF